MTLYVATPSQVAQVQPHLPARLQFAQPEGDVLIHDGNLAPFYPGGPDAVAQAAGFADYASLVAALELASDYEILLYDYISQNGDLFVPPTDVDFRITSPKLTKTIGQRDAGGYVTRWDWVELVFNAGTMQVEVAETVVCEHHTYTIVDSVPVKRDEEIQWMRRNGMPHPTTKTREKFYNTPQAIAKEGQKRRGFLLEEVLGTVGAWLLGNGYSYADGQALSGAFSELITMYIRDTNPQLVLDIHGASAATYPWLDDPFGDGRTVREYMTDTLNIYGLTLP